MALAIAVASGLGCKAKSTFVHVTLTSALTEPSGIKSIELQLTLGGQSASTTLRESSGADIAFPTDTTLQIGSGAGQLVITAIARAADGRELDRGVNFATVVSGAITEVAVAMAGKPNLQPAEARHDFGQVSLGQTSATVNLSFINSGYKPTGPLTTVLGGAGASAFSAGVDDCAGKTLLPSASCSVAVTFHPTAAVAVAATVAVTGTPGGTGVVAITGTGIARPQTLISVTAPATSGGTVTSSPGGLSCTSSGGVCSASFDTGSNVTLAATSDATARFGSWGGDCASAAGSVCAFNPLSAAKNVSAIFVRQFPLQVTVNGSGQNTASAPGGITNCSSVGGTCTASFDSGASVTVTAAPLANTRVSWAGCTSSSGNSCTVVMTTNISVGVSFINTVSFIVNKSTSPATGSQSTVSTADGKQVNGVGNLSSTFTVDTNTSVTLQARPLNGSNLLFGGWQNVTCAGSKPLQNDCTFTPVVSPQMSVTANFVPQPYNTIFVSSTLFPSTLGGARAYDSECNKLASKAGINDSAGTAFFAYLSDDKSNAVDQFTQLGVTAQGFSRMDGQPFGNTVADLTTNNAIYYPILFDETGANTAVTGVGVFTWSGGDSTGRSATGQNCANWTTNGPNVTGGGVLLGEVSQGPNFGSGSGFEKSDCSNVHRIDCIERDKTTAITVQVTLGKMIFISPAISVSTGASIATFDKACQSPTTPNSLALLSTTLQSAAKHALTSSQAYVTPGGQFIGLGVDVAQGQGHWSTGVWQNSSGAFIGGSLVFTGSPSPSQTGTVAQTCSDWNDFSTLQVYPALAFTNQTSQLWYASGVQVTCDAYSPAATPIGRAYVYCVEQ